MPFYGCVLLRTGAVMSRSTAYLKDTAQATLAILFRKIKACAVKITFHITTNIIEYAGVTSLTVK